MARVNGARAAEFTLQLNSNLLKLDRPGLEMLAYAVRHHSAGHIEADITVQTCWDADRLDLGRVGITPRPDRLCTEEARDPVLFERAYRAGEEFRARGRWWRGSVRGAG
jgi:uncharacterized protein